MKFLFDLFPIILFFAAFKVWGIFTATAVAIVATLAQARGSPSGTGRSTRCCGSAWA
ncbi:intracellular septation protein A [Burkholderia cepacia]|nr:intracellular septation protein A [Burkholderia cepacia]